LTAEQAEAYLASLEPIGWKLGLERIRRLTQVMGMPQHRFGSLHVVGTNGKTSVALMIEALLEAHGIAAGAYVSPHIGRWAERIRLRGAPVADPEFAAAVERTAQAAEAVDRALSDELGKVTQFETVTGAAFYALAAGRVEAAAIEAGLGGRLDATNVIPSRVCVLTSIGLDHTEWLGDTEEEIAAEKLAVLREHSTLVVGRLREPILVLAERTAAERAATFVHAPEDPGREVVLRAPGSYQRRNFALAMAAVEALVGGVDADAARRVAAEIVIPGRTQVFEGEPPLILDAAHNPDGARALAEALPDLAGGRPVIACVAVLDDKDARSMLEALAPACERIVCTEIPVEVIRGSGRPVGRSLPATELAALCEAAGVDWAEAVAEPAEALDRALELARSVGGVALATGSHYLLNLRWTERPAPSSSR
jgi:dihydrofolate synthase/folylpolyglutamate synthase